MHLKLSSLAAVALLLAVAVLGSGSIAITVNAADVEDPLRVEAIPHILDATYTLTDPSYETAFDDSGGFRVSTGTPGVVLEDSKLNLSAPAATKVELTLASTDEPGINTTVRDHIQLKLLASSLGSQYTNFSAWNDGRGDYAIVSLHGSAAYYAFNVGAAETTGTLYSPVYASTYYRVAIELTSSGVTFFIYSAAGALLGNHYANTPDLRVALVTELRVSVEGHAGYALLDNLFCVDETPGTGACGGAALGADAMEASDSYSNGRVAADPSTQDRTVSSDSAVRAAFGLDGTDLASLLERGEWDTDQILDVTGQMGEYGQRCTGRFFAKGWDDFKGTLESAIRQKIADNQGVSVSDVHLVDYYVDYLQWSTGVSETVRQNMAKGYWNGLAGSARTAGADVTYASGSASQIVPYAPAAMSAFPTIGLGPARYLPSIIPAAAVVIAAIVIGASVCAAGYMFQSGANAMANAPKEYLDAANRMWNDTQARIDASLRNASDEVDRNMRSIGNMTAQKFEQLQSDLGAGFTTFRTGVNDTISKFTDDLAQRITSLDSDFADFKDSVWQDTNAVYSELLRQSESNSAAIANITSAIFSGEYGSNFWSDYMSGGKPGSGPLTQGAWFGSGLLTPQVIVIVFLIALALIVVALLLMRGGRKGNKARGRRSA